MIGRARRLGVHFVDGEFIDEIEAKINRWLEGNGGLNVIDIRYQMSQVNDNVKIYFAVQIIYQLRSEGGTLT